MFSIWQVIAFIGVGAFCAILGVMFGAWLSYKCHRAVPGERFLGGPPEGKVFSIPDLEEEPDPIESGIVKDRLNQFMMQFNGGEK
jgi:hypothetical protein